MKILFKYRYYALFILFILYQNLNYKKIMFFLFSYTSIGKKYIEEKKAKVKKIIKNQISNKSYDSDYNTLPEKSKNKDTIISLLEKRKYSLNEKISGCIYTNDKELDTLLTYAIGKYMYSNPLHLDIFPELGKMESEIIRMVGHLYDLPKNGGGNLTTGGTESTILALKAYRDYFKARKWYLPINKPLVLCSKTCHAAVNKACDLLNLDINYIKLNKNYTMDIEDLKNKISYKTCVVVISMPCFPYGLNDSLDEISNICQQYNVPLHVDACLGGFITQFSENKISFKKNIQSLSIDPHKFGCAPKGSSVLLWKNKNIKHYQHFIASEWTGGIYASTSLPGSRVGSHIVSTWCSLLYHGIEKYEKNAKDIIAKTIQFKKKLALLDYYIVIGNPMTNVVAFYNSKYSVGQIVNHLHKNNWNINILQNPICLHICITNKNISKIDELYILLKDVLSQESESVKEDSMVSIYGLSAKIQDKGIMTHLINYYLDLTTSIQ